MKYFIVTGLTLCAGASVAVAEPLRLSSAEVDQITASGFTSALVAAEGRMEVVIRVTRDGQTLIDRQFVHSVPAVPASLDPSLDGIGEEVARNAGGNLPRADLPDVRTVDLPTIDVPRPAALAKPSVEAAPAVDLVRAPVVQNAVEPARPVEAARPATHFQPAELVRSIEAQLGQVEASSPPAASSGFTVQRTHVVAHSAGSMASAAARNVNITR